MQQNQNSLGSKKVHRTPSYQNTNIGRVTSVKNFEKFGMIEVVFLDYGMPFPVWVNNDIDREPVTGDQVIIGFIDGRKDAPYLMGFVKNYNYTTNFINVKKDRIRIQLPVYKINERDKLAHNDTKDNLLKDTKLSKRAYVELNPEKALVSFPVDMKGRTATAELTHDSIVLKYPITEPRAGQSPADDDVNLPDPAVAKITMTGGNITIHHPSGITLDTPSVSCTGSVGIAGHVSSGSSSSGSYAGGHV